MNNLKLFFLGSLLSVLTYVDTEYFGYNFLNIFAAFIVSFWAAVSAGSLSKLIKHVILIFIGNVARMPLTVFILSLIKNKDMGLHLYVGLLKMNGLMGFFVLIPMVLVAPLIYFIKRQFIELKKS